MAFHKKGESKYVPTSIEAKPVVYRPKYKKSKRKKHSEHELPEICRFCINAHKLYDSDTMLCDRKGVVACEYSCKKFLYDPLKHIPAQSPLLKPENAEPLPSLDDFNEIDDIQNSEIVQEEVAETAANSADTAITSEVKKEANYSETYDKMKNPEIAPEIKDVSDDKKILSQLAEIDRQYNMLQRNLDEYTEFNSDDIQTDNISDAASNIFSPENAIAMKKESEDADSE